MSEHFQVAVIGAGPGGYVAALKAAQLGAKVAVVEKHHLGGTCLNYGCIPSKALLSSAELLHQLTHAQDWGIKLNGMPEFDWPAIQKRKDKVIAGLRGGISSLFKGRKVTAFQGAAKLDGPGKIAVLNEKGVTNITADKVILAVGSVPAWIPGWPTDPAIVCTSDEAVHWKDLPKRLLIIGGGVIGCEFACMMQAFGVQVTVVEMLPSLLALLDQDLGAGLTTIFKKRGITVYADVKVNELKVTGAIATATLSNGTVIAADRVLVATGRKPNTREIGLESVGIEMSPRGFVKVNDYMETPVGGYYCIGDANGQCLLAHAASAHGVAAAENALGHAHAFHAPIPAAVYTFPEIGSVGLTEQEAHEQGLPIALGKFPIGHLGKAMAANHTDGFVKLLKHRETGELLGAHVMGHNATEVIAACAALLHQQVTLTEVAETVWAHPTISEAVKEAAEDALGMGLHLPPRKVIRVTV